MSDLNLYWAEEVLGEPYAPQDYRWMKSTRRVGLMLGGATCALTASVLLGSAAYLQVDSSPHVAISSYEIEVVAQASPQAPPLPAIIPESIPAVPAAPAERTSDVRTSLKESLPRPIATGPAVASKPATAPAAAKIKEAPAPPPARPRPSTVPAGEKTQLAKATETPRAAAAPAQVPAQAQAKVIPAPAAAAPAAPAAKPEPDTRMGISKGADSKPTDIASGEKLGIREILPDGIVMHNGRKIRNGSPLPNGEILMGTDAGKGMAETDRRVLVLTP
ncbi:hypothetical protein ACFPOU_07860 [Massilia jejuensis]|uniref:Uncharacterized protein n=1 Tax=Massilia jejuensis TaxID=648894 RepID=A0ABW0PGL0_9BURK